MGALGTGSRVRGARRARAAPWAPERQRRHPRASLLLHSTAWSPSPASRPAGAALSPSGRALPLPCVGDPPGAAPLQLGCRVCLAQQAGAGLESGLAGPLHRPSPVRLPMCCMPLSLVAPHPPQAKESCLRVQGAGELKSHTLWKAAHVHQVLIQLVRRLSPGVVRTFLCFFFQL